MNKIIRILLNKYIAGEITKQQVYKAMLELGIMKSHGVYKCETVSSNFLQLLDDKTTIILKGE